MEVKVTRVTDWQRVCDATRQTVNKEPLGHEPSDKFKENLIRAEHSPIRLLEFDIECKNVPFSVVSHLTRHKIGVEFFVASARPDRNGNKVSREQQTKADPTNFRFSVNAQALINISRKRLCRKAEATTRMFWAKVQYEILKVEPILHFYMVPECVYRGFCPEISSCGYVCNLSYSDARNEYLRGYNKLEVL